MCVWNIYIILRNSAHVDGVELDKDLLEGKNSQVSCETIVF